MSLLVHTVLDSCMVRDITCFAASLFFKHVSHFEGGFIRRTFVLGRAAN